MRPTREDFLNECTESERETFRQIFTAVDEFSRTLGSPDEADSPTRGRGGRPRLFFDFEDHKGALMLQHAKLGRRPLRLMLGGSSRVGREEMVEAFSVQLPKLVSGGIARADAEAFLRDLENAGFEKRKEGLWRTQTANTNRPDRLSSIFGREANLRGLTEALRRLVENVDRYV